MAGLTAICLAATACGGASGDDGVAAYLAVVNRHRDTLQTESVQTASVCKNNNLVACRTDASQLKAQATAAQRDLDRTSVPGCLWEVDEQVSQAVEADTEGADALLQGVTAHDGGDILVETQMLANGIYTLELGLSNFKSAQDAISKANC